VADRYWNARGGSYEDGGAFIFSLTPDSNGKMRMTCTDKFESQVSMPKQDEPCDFSRETIPDTPLNEAVDADIKKCMQNREDGAVFEFVRENIHSWSFDDVRTAVRAIKEQAKDSEKTEKAINALTLLNDLKYPVGSKKRSHILHVIRSGLNLIFDELPRFDSEDVKGSSYRLIDYPTRGQLRAPLGNEKTLVIDATLFPPEGNESDATYLVDGYYKGWRNFITYHCKGQRYVGCGLGPDSEDVTIDVFGSSGDYLGSGLDGLTIRVHNNAQDQVGQIMKRGKLVIYGDAGQTFMYGAKGGAVYVMGNAAGRPLINSVGRPRVVINGTCLDFLAESFMAGDPHNGGGFVILNGVRLDEEGNIVPLPEPYPGSNLFSLASGGAIFVRDPHKICVEGQLNGGMYLPLTEEDWELILPFLEENERLFNIKIDTLLTVDGKRLSPLEVYRKVVPIKVGEAILKKTNALSHEQNIEAETVGDLN
jgi:glutamate synthase domain-containing protein 3